jgi:hypothetical protein
MARTNTLKDSLRPAPPASSILDEDPRGRMDIAVVRLAEATCKRALGPAGAVAWDHGLGDVVEAVVVANGIPSKPLTAVDIARAAGILPPAPRPKKIGGRR